MEQLRNLNSTVQRARSYYERHGALPYYRHGHDALREAIAARMVDGSTIRRSSVSPERRLANYVLAETLLHHTIEPGRVVDRQHEVPPSLAREDVWRELAIFSRLTGLEAEGRPMSDFLPLLNNGRAPLALLAKLADHAITHDPSERPRNGSSLKIFRNFPTEESALGYLKNSACAGEMIYAPAAELFGYSRLSGNIFANSYRTNHTDIYETVMALRSSPELQERMLRTQQFVKSLMRSLRFAFADNGFDVEMELRPEKHPGKLMRKAYRLLEGDLKKVLGMEILKVQSDCGIEYSEGQIAEMMRIMLPMRIQRFIAENICGLDFEARVNDWVAIRVIVKRYKREDIDQMDEAQRDIALRIAHEIISGALSVKFKVGGFLRGVEIRDDKPGCPIIKNNGYTAYHWDSRIKLRETSFVPLLPFEVQMKTRKWHFVSEHGGAAHYYYIGGDEALMGAISAAYHDLIHALGKGDTRPSRPPCG